MSQKKYPPLAEVRPYKYEKFGITVEDNYAWLKDDNWQLVVKNPGKLSSDIRNYLESENESSNRNGTYQEIPRITFF